MKNGLLLINLGTPDKPDKTAVKRYLREFLSDRRVINLPAPIRYFLLYAFILPFRPRTSAKAYQSIWTERGSPLLVHSQNLQHKLQELLQDHCQVALGMRYGKPSIESALAELKACEAITVLPLYPQYSSAATGSSIEKTFNLLTNKNTFPNLRIVRDFYQHPDFISAQAKIISPYLTGHDHVLFSYHGIPENHLRTNECKKICSRFCSSDSSLNASCYRAQCFRTTALVAKELNLTADRFTTSFQSRLGKTAWIQPYTDKILIDLANNGIKKLAVACPSFVADCLETLEEIGLRAKEQWLKLGGERLTLIPSLNDNDEWINAVLNITRPSADNP